MSEGRESTWKWIAEDEKASFSYLAGLLDAEGNITAVRDRSNTELMVNYYNTDVEMLRFVVKVLRKAGFHANGPYLDKLKGTVSSGFGIPHRKDYWHVSVERCNDCQTVLRVLPIRHAEKIQKAGFATSLVFRQPWNEAEGRYVAIRNAIREATRSFVAEAGNKFAETHADR